SAAQTKGREPVHIVSLPTVDARDQAMTLGPDKGDGQPGDRIDAEGVPLLPPASILEPENRASPLVPMGPAAMKGVEPRRESLVRKLDGIPLERIDPEAKVNPALVGVPGNDVVGIRLLPSLEGQVSGLIGKRRLERIV